MNSVNTGNEQMVQVQRDSVCDTSSCQLVVQASVLLAKSYALQFGCLERVFFAGGFLERNDVARAGCVFAQAGRGNGHLPSRHCHQVVV